MAGGEDSISTHNTISVITWLD